MRRCCRVALILAIFMVSFVAFAASAAGESAILKVEADKTKVSGESLDVEGDVNVDGDVKIDTSKDEDLPDSISLKSLYKEVQILKNNQNSDEDDSGK